MACPHHDSHLSQRADLQSPTDLRQIFRSCLEANKNSQNHKVHLLFSTANFSETPHTKRLPPTKKNQKKIKKNTLGKRWGNKKKRKIQRNLERKKLAPWSWIAWSHSISSPSPAPLRSDPTANVVLELPAMRNRGGVCLNNIKAKYAKLVDFIGFKHFQVITCAKYIKLMYQNIPE